MILGGVGLQNVIHLREEYEALTWIKNYVSERHWMQRNNVDMTSFSDEIMYQTLEAKFKFTQKRLQTMM